MAESEETKVQEQEQESSSQTDEVSDERSAQVEEVSPEDAVVDWKVLLEDDTEVSTENVSKEEGKQETPVEETASEEESEEGVATDEVEQVFAQEPPTEPAPATKKVSGEASAAEIKAPTQQELLAARNQLKEQIRQRYQMDENMGDEFIQNIHQKLPEMLAEVHTAALSDAWNYFQQLMPQMVGQQLQQRRVADEYEKRFFEMWPKLTGHRDAVERVARAYRMQNPLADPETTMREVGAQTSVSLRIPPDEMQERKAERRSPPKPAQPGSGVKPKPAPKPLGDYEQLAEEWLADEAG